MTPTPTLLRIATRKSPLALYQAEFVKAALMAVHPHLTVELVLFTTTGDKILNDSLSKAGGKGLFVKELEQALLDNTADIAVHSMKDVPIYCAEGLDIAAICERSDPRDAFLSNHYQRFLDLPQGAIVGTSSLRRQSIVKHLRPDITIQLMRGNVDTRVKKLLDGQYDAIVLAAAGLQRLNLEEHIKQYFNPEEMLPAVGQGAIGIECRANDKAIKKLLMPLNHFPTESCVIAERKMNTVLNGGCHTPVAGYATYQGDQLLLRGLVGKLDGSKIIRAEVQGHIKDARKIGHDVANQLLEKGAGEILKNPL